MQENRGLAKNMGASGKLLEKKWQSREGIYFIFSKTRMIQSQIPYYTHDMFF